MPRVFVAYGLGGEELVEFGAAAMVVGLVDDFFGGLEVVGDGWLVLISSLVGAGAEEFRHGEVVVAEVEPHFAAVGDFEDFFQDFFGFSVVALLAVELGAREETAR